MKLSFMPARRQPAKKPRKKGSCYFRGDRRVSLGCDEYDLSARKIVRAVKKAGTTRPELN